MKLAFLLSGVGHPKVDILNDLVSIGCILNVLRQLMNYVSCGKIVHEFIANI